MRAGHDPNVEKEGSIFPLLPLPSLSLFRSGLVEVRFRGSIDPFFPPPVVFFLLPPRSATAQQESQQRVASSLATLPTGSS